MENVLSGREVLGRGQHGEEVRHFQKLLNAVLPASDKSKTLAEDGYFGRRTEERVRKFQASAGIRSDGSVGHATTARAIEHYAHMIANSKDLANLTPLDRAEAETAIIRNARTPKQALEMGEMMKSEVFGRALQANREEIVRRLNAGESPAAAVANTMAHGRRVYQGDPE